jgi:hypothetical protein
VTLSASVPISRNEDHPRCIIDLTFKVPTAALGNRGVNRKKLRGLTTMTLNSLVSMLFNKLVAPHPVPRMTRFFFSGSKGS